MMALTKSSHSSELRVGSLVHHSEEGAMKRRDSGRWTEANVRLKR